MTRFCTQSSEYSLIHGAGDYGQSFNGEGCLFTNEPSADDDATWLVSNTVYVNQTVRAMMMVSGSWERDFGVLFRARLRRRSESS